MVMARRDALCPAPVDGAPRSSLRWNITQKMWWSHAECTQQVQRRHLDLQAPEPRRPGLPALGRQRQA